jgi:hypothetical protein
MRAAINVHGVPSRVPTNAFPQSLSALRALWLATALVASSSVAQAQELKEQPTPFSAWLDFKSLAKNKPRKDGLPIWIESIERMAVVGNRAVVRIHFRRMGALTEQLQLRLFFLDKPGASPTVTGWTETGAQPYTSPALGAGLGVDTSESLIIPAADLDYIDIDVPGDGKNLRGVFVTSLKKAEVMHALDFAAPDGLVDPFGAPSPSQGASDDVQLYGRVRATIDAAPLTIDPKQGGMGTYEFSLDNTPMLASISCEVLGATPLEPVLAYVNGQYVGPVSIKFPDLADPGYRGVSGNGRRNMTFRYTGWLSGQIMIPGTRLAQGLNSVVLRLSSEGKPIVVRSVEIQLKNPSPTFDYDLHP